ncbi:hypothetical protein B6N60_03316 [Richelia sinica FACHB-800]|uniref:Thymidylate synthase n=1 Tax=Richelia sinica FACHB-800 TaxID=1357546 RepID=A0A975T9J0_9NOST|nr:PqqD family peptide modification chaperone [Richelia sinica]MBD2663430.1 PqqD family protein [Richelia sinica FACHB-800]QXE24610.1 hypothetical protein B6N60_03316 [Richelia sinica FACHB-800]
MNSKKLESQILDSSVLVAVSEQVSSDIGGEVVILNLKSGVYHGLNEVGARIWSLIQEAKTVQEVKATLLQEYAVEQEQCDREVQELLQQLQAAELIEVKNETFA